ISRMLQVGKILEQSLAVRYKQEIEHFIREGSFTDALEQLFDFARDFAPSRSNEVIVLHSKYSILRKQVRLQSRLSADADPGILANEILELCGEIHQTAHVRKELQIPAEQTISKLPEPLAQRVEETATAVARRTPSSLNDMRELYINTWRESTRNERET